MWSLEFTNEAVRQIDALTGKVRRQVDTTLAQIAGGERQGRPLRGELWGLRSERVGNHRIIYREEHGRLTILVITVAHRKLVYGGH